MAELKILVKGYIRRKSGFEFASSATILITDGSKKIIVDPGMNKRLLINALKKDKLKTNDINYVVLTHIHPDHSLLAGLFDKAIVIDENYTYSWNGKMSKHAGIIPGTSIKLIKTPGHDPYHCSLLVNTKKGKVVIAGDLFWWGYGEKQKTDYASLIKHDDIYATNKKQLINSRKRILRIADYVIPGHGKMFKVNK